MKSREFRKAFLFFIAAVILGIAAGLVFCTAHIDSNDCAMNGVPYLKAIILGIGGAFFLLGLGGGMGLSARYAYSIIQKRDIDVRKYQEMIFDLVQLHIYAALGFTVFILTL